MCKRPEEQGEMAWLTVTCYGRPGKYVRMGIKRIWREHQKVSDIFYFRIFCYKDIQPCAYAVIFVLVYIYIHECDKCKLYGSSYYFCCLFNWPTIVWIWSKIFHRLIIPIFPFNSSLQNNIYTLWSLLMQFDGLRWRDKGKHKSLWTPKDLNKNTTLKKIINIDTSWLKEDLPTERISNLMALQKGTK